MAKEKVSPSYIDEFFTPELDEYLRATQTPQRIADLREASQIMLRLVKREAPQVLPDVIEEIPPEQRMEGLRPEERLEGLKPEEIVAGLNAGEREALLKLLTEQNQKPKQKRKIKQKQSNEEK